jgi:hypothetical protein
MLARIDTSGGQLPKVVSGGVPILALKQDTRRFPGIDCEHNHRSGVMHEIAADAKASGLLDVVGADPKNRSAIDGAGGDEARTRARLAASRGFRHADNITRRPGASDFFSVLSSRGERHCSHEGSMPLAGSECAASKVHRSLAANNAAQDDSLILLCCPA